MQYKAFISYSHAADGQLAPAVQAALQSFAKPWYRLRALRIFRDKTSLAATPSLWGSIERALQQSEYFVLLASPKAAASVWISREVEWWLANRDTSKMLIVLTGGDLLWNPQANDFDPQRTTAVPEALFGRLHEEPLYVDLRWARDADHLSLRNTRFRGAILDLAATLQGRPKDELDGDDVREHRKTRRIAGSAVAVLVLLTVAALIAASIAVLQSRIARSRELAASARTELAVDPQLSLILAKAAVEESRTEQAEGALREAILKSNVRLVQRRHTREVTNAMFSGDNAVSVSFDKQVLVWDANTGAIKYTFPGHRAAVCGEQIVTAGDPDISLWSLADGHLVHALPPSGLIDDIAFSPDCQWIATAGRDNAARLYRAATGEPVGPVLRDPDILIKVSFSPNSQLLVTNRIYNRTDVWTVPTGRPVLSSPGYATAFSPNVQLLVVGGADNSGVRIWDVAKRKLLSTEFIQPGSINSVAFSPDGSLFVTAGTDRTARVWDARRLRPVAVLLGHTGDVVSAAFGHRGKFIVTASADRTARVWVAHTGELVAELRGHDDRLNTAVFSPDDRRVLTSSDDGTAAIWSTGMADPVLELTESGSVTQTLDPAVVGVLEAASSTGLLEGYRTVEHVAFSANGQLALLAADTNTTEVWRPRTAERLAQVTGTIAAFSPNAQLFATGAEDGTIRIFRTAAGELVRELGTHHGYVSGLAFSSDGKMIGSAGEDSSARIYHVDSGEVVARLDGHTEALSGLWFSPDGTTVLTTSFDRAAILWRLPEGRKSATWQHDKPVMAAAFSADGRLAATADSGGVAKIWEVASGNLVAELRGHAGGISDIHFNASGNRLLTASGDGTARVWRLDGRGAVATVFVMRGHTGGVARAIWSPDERYVATASSDYTVRLWEGSTGRMITAIGTHADSVRDIAFSPDGAYLMSGSEDGTAHIYACEVCAPTDRLLTLAATRITRPPTDLEIRNFGLERSTAGFESQ
jgi:WD40 repeat protein